MPHRVDLEEAEVADDGEDVVAGVERERAVEFADGGILEGEGDGEGDFLGHAVEGEFAAGGQRAVGGGLNDVEGEFVVVE